MGISSKQPLSEMNPLYSPELLNVFGDNGALTRRNGFTSFRAFGADSLFEHVSESGTRSIVGTRGGYCYNITSGSTDITGAASISSNESYGVNFGGRLYLKTNDNTKDVYYWTGSGNLTAAAFTGPGGDDKALVNILAYKSRLYFVEYNAASLWYGTVGGLTGALVELDLTKEFTLGGYILFAHSISSVSGDQSQEMLAIVSNMGEVLVYQGDYPGSLAWSRVGRYFIPAPIGRKSFFTWGADIIAITRQGVVSLLDVMNQNARGQLVYLTDEINGLFQAEVSAAITASAATWQFTGIVYPNGNYLVISMGLLGTMVSSVQFVMNLQTRAWFKFQGMPASCWTLYNNDLYFGTSSDTGGGTFKANNGPIDVDMPTGINAENMSIVIRHAYNYFGDREGVKQFTEALPVLTISTAATTLTIDSDVDFADDTPTSVTPSIAVGNAIPRCGLKGIGQCASIRIEQTVTNAIFSLKATTVRFIPGGIS